MPLPEFNGFKHGFTGRATIMTDEDRLEQYAFTREYVKVIDPWGILEIQLTRSLAMDTWRLNRLRAIEENLLAFGAFGPAANIEAENAQVHHAFTQARVFSREFKVLNTLSLIEQRLNRNIQANLKLLIKLQDRRQAADDRRQAETSRLNVRPEADTKPLTRTAAVSLVAEAPAITLPDVA